MTQDEIILIAHKANFEGFGNGDWVCTTEEIQHFAQLVAAHEREACAKVCEVHGSMAKHSVWMAEECAALIRARGSK